MSQPAIVQVKRVSVPRGASPPGRTPRRTSTAGVGGLRRERRPGAAETLASPAVGQADDDRAGSRRHVDEGFRVRLDQDRLGGDAERALHRDRGAREQPAGVAAVGDGRRARELERHAASACEPRAELDRRPVVLGPREGHEHGTRARRLVPDDDADVARRLIEQREHARVLEQAVRRVDEEEIDVVLACEPCHVHTRGDRREHCGPCLDAVRDETGAELVRERGGHSELVRGRGGRRQQQLSRRLPCERRREVRETLEPLQCERGDEERPARARDRLAPRARMGELRVLAEDRGVQFAQPRARLDAELGHQHRPGAAVCLERFGLSPRPVQRGHQEPAGPFAERMLRHEPLERGNDVDVAPEGELRLHPTLEREDPQLLEPRDDRRERRLVREVGERRPPPEEKRLGEGVGGPCGIVPLERLRSLVREPLEPLEVERALGDMDDVTAAAGLDCVAPSALRSPETYPWTRFAAVAGGSSPQRPSTSRDAGTTVRGWQRRSASVARCFGPPSRASRPSTSASSGPRRR